MINMHMKPAHVDKTLTIKPKFFTISSAPFGTVLVMFKAVEITLNIYRKKKDKNLNKWQISSVNIVGNYIHMQYSINHNVLSS